MPGTQEITQVGKREDLADIISVADAKNTPLTSMLRKGKKPNNTLFDWQADAYGATSTDGVPEGTDVSSYEDAAENRQRLQGRLQKFWKTAMVTTEAEEISDVAGINNPDPQGVAGATEFARAKAKKSVELKRNVESALLSDNDSVQQAGATARKTRGLGSWLSNSAQTDLPVPAAFRTPAASIYSSAIGSFTEDSLKALLQSRWSETGSSDDLKCITGTGVKNVVSDFTRYQPDKSSNSAIRRFTGEAMTKKVTNTVDVYEGDYGTVEFHLDSFMPNATRAYILDMRMVELRWSIQPRFKPLPDLGAGPRGLIETILGLAVLNPLSGAKIAATA